MNKIRTFLDGLWTVAIMVSFPGVPGVLIGRWISRDGAAPLTPYFEDFVIMMSWVAVVGIIWFIGSNDYEPKE